MGYAHPEVLVTTDWVHEHRSDPSVRLLEVDVDPDAYTLCHVPGAVGLDWHVDLCDVWLRDVLPHDRFEQVMSRAGISRDTKVILYGDSNNWFAAWAFWQMKMYGHERVQLMDGGRAKWLAEGRVVTTDAPEVARTVYAAPPLDARLRAMLPEVQRVVETSMNGAPDPLRGPSTVNLVDVRSPAEFTGEILAPPGLPETCQRGGHIPGAVNVPWSRACREDGTFKSEGELRAIYAEAGVDFSRPTIAYCRIGERSSHTWFVLKYLIGQSDVKNYDGSWTEWGNLVRAPIAR